jgi:hypothetical protein
VLKSSYIPIAVVDGVMTIFDQTIPEFVFVAAVDLAQTCSCGITYLQKIWWRLFD